MNTTTTTAVGDHFAAITVYSTFTSMIYPSGFSFPLVMISYYINAIFVYIGNILATISWKLLYLVIMRIPYFLYSSSSIKIPLYIILVLLFILAKLAYGVFDKKYVHAYTKKNNKTMQNDEYNDDVNHRNNSKNRKKLQSKSEEETDYLSRQSKFDKLFSRVESKPQNNSHANSLLTKYGKTASPEESYLNKFLKAIQIFKYLDSHVFNELTKSIKSERLSKGELLLLNDISGFVILVEGSIGIYYKIDNNIDIDSYNDDDSQSVNSNKTEGMKENDGNNNNNNNNEQFDNYCVIDGEQFQLLNIVKEGHPVSSLVSILRLFAHQEDFVLSDASSSNSIKLPQLIAKASRDCTIAIIPPEAFQNLTIQHPRSASQMIQMILTKLYRVSFQTAHKYLGLTKEIMKTEVLLNSNFQPTRNSAQLHKFLVNMIDSGLNTNSNNLDINNTSSITGILGSRQISMNQSNKTNTSIDLISAPTPSKSNIFEHTLKTSDANSPYRVSSPFYRQDINEDKWRSSLIDIFFEFLGINKTNISPQTHLSTDIRDSSISPLPRVPKVIQSNGIRIYKVSPPHINQEDFEMSNSESNNLSTESIDYESATNEFSKGLEVEFIPNGSVIVKENEHLDGLLYVISGVVEATVKDPDTNKKSKVYTASSGNILGFLSSLVGNSKSFATLQAKTDLYIAFLPSKIIEHLCDKYFMIYLRIAETLISSLSSKLLKLDYALEWIHLGASQILFKRNDPADAIYVVLSGRLREFLNKDTIIKELIQGESFGEVEILTSSKRLSTVISIRDTDLARIPRTLYEYLAIEHPSTMFKVSRLVAKQILQTRNQPSTQSKFVSDTGFKYDFDLSIPPTTRDNQDAQSTNDMSIESSTTYRTIAILPLRQGMPVQDFAIKLIHSFKDVGRTVIGLDQRTVLNHLGKHAFNKLAKIKESGYFADLEESYQTVVYIDDSPANSNWTSTCVAQADCVLLLADDQDVATRSCLGDYEKVLLRSEYTPRVELILLHPSRYVEPGSTQQWLKLRPFIDSFHHVEFNAKQFMALDPEINNEASTPQSLFLTNMKNRFIEKVKKGERLNKFTQKTSKFIPATIKSLVQQQFRSGNTNLPSVLHKHKNDFSRLARILSNQSIGVVLGGGGARGVSHIGFLKALEDQGIPIDVIGGTSIGALVGGLYAKEYDIVPIYGRVKQFCSRIGSLWRMMSDLTLPITAYTTGHEFNKGVWTSLGDSRIEDFWLQFYCNSTNITESLHEIHTKGIAWRYIRASMSLVSCVPPMVDSNGSMLCDGGYIENVAVQELTRRGCKTIFAVDVGANDIRTKMDYGDYASGFWILLNRWNPFSSHPNVPNITEIQVRLGYISSVNALEKAKSTPGVIYARPPVESIGTLAFNQFQEIYEIGEKYGQSFLKYLKDNNKLPELPGCYLDRENDMSKPLLQRRSSI